MKSVVSSFAQSELIVLHGNDWLEKQRIAGKIVAQTLNLLENLVINKTSLSLIELNKLAEEFIEKAGATCTFKEYKGFPAGVCISVNQQLVHGIPTEYKLQEGDVVSFDLGATVDGAIADSALTCIYGESKSQSHIKLVQATKEALTKGIEAIKVGKRIGCIGHAIYKSAKGNGFSVINSYGGHGISWNRAHSNPFIANRSSLDEGIVIQPGLTIAIEPLLVIGNSTATHVADDKWTVSCDDICAHEEHSIYVHEDYVEIITDRK